MNDEFYKHLLSIERQLAELNTRSASIETGQQSQLKAAGSLEERVRVLEDFRSRILGGVFVAGALGGVIGALLSTLLAHLL